ncbi:hypothetical protein BC829DRAFT_11828 [Chytridium lagenaria]|nr:hypothetical protein BC829DRAFT_11828 [Chytridium lagenaria]
MNTHGINIVPKQQMRMWLRITFSLPRRRASPSTSLRTLMIGPQKSLCGTLPSYWSILLLRTSHIIGLSSTQTDSSSRASCEGQIIMNGEMCQVRLDRAEKTQFGFAKERGGLFLAGCLRSPQDGVMTASHLDRLPANKLDRFPKAYADAFKQFKIYQKC